MCVTVFASFTYLLTYLVRGKCGNNSCRCGGGSEAKGGLRSWGAACEGGGQVGCISHFARGQARGGGGGCGGGGGGGAASADGARVPSAMEGTSGGWTSAPRCHHLSAYGLLWGAGLWAAAAAAEGGEAGDPTCRAAGERVFDPVLLGTSSGRHGRHAQTGESTPADRLPHCADVSIQSLPYFLLDMSRIFLSPRCPH